MANDYVPSRAPEGRDYIPHHAVTSHPYFMESALKRTFLFRKDRCSFQDAERYIKLNHNGPSTGRNAKPDRITLVRSFIRAVIWDYENQLKKMENGDV